MYGVKRRHHTSVHEDMKKEFPEDFKKMRLEGVVSDQLMQGLLSSESPHDWVVVLGLMLKFDLVSCMMSKGTDGNKHS